MLKSLDAAIENVPYDIYTAPRVFDSLGGAGMFVNVTTAETSTKTTETFPSEMLKATETSTKTAETENLKAVSDAEKARLFEVFNEYEKSGGADEWRAVWELEQRQMLERLLAEQQMKLEMEGGRVREEYGEALTDHEVLEVLKVEKELAQCVGCTGLPCKKSKNKLFVPTAKYDLFCKSLDVRRAVCPFENIRRLQMQLDKKYKLSKIPAEYLGKTFADYTVDADNSYAVEVARKLIELPDKGAYFYGKVGTGKTFLAAIIAQEVIKRGRQVIFATVPTISMQIRSTFKDKSTLTESDVLEKLYKVPTLILDDVGMEKPTRFISSMLCNIFNERYNARLQTIMTSNYPLKAMEKIFNKASDGEDSLDGTRIYDRCKQMCVPIELKGGSRRC